MVNEKSQELSYWEYKAIVESSPNMIWRAGLDGKCNYFNETWLKFTGRTFEQENGNGWTEGVHEEDFDFCLNTYLENFNKRQAFEMEYRLKRFDGQWRWINDRGVPFFHEDGEFAGYIGSCMDVTEKVEGENLTEMAHYDVLTGLFNRNYIDYLLDYEFHKSRQENTDYLIMMMDVDKFKFVNDQYGHTFGDKVLNQVGHKISTDIRKTDFAGRYGGDEFVVILPSTTLEEAEIISDRILKSVNEISFEGVPLEVSLSIGIVKKTVEVGVRDLVEKADKAMYSAKHDGGNQMKFFKRED